MCDRSRLMYFTLQVSAYILGEKCFKQKNEFPVENSKCCSIYGKVLLQTKGFPISPRTQKIRAVFSTFFEVSLRMLWVRVCVWLSSCVHLIGYFFPFEWKWKEWSFLLQCLCFPPQNTLTFCSILLLTDSDSFFRIV